MSELTGIHPETKEVIVIDIFNDRGAAGLQPTGYLPTFIDSLIEKRLLESKFLYGDMDGEDDSRRAIAGGAAQQTLSPPSTFNIPAPPPPHSRPIAHDTGREQATAGDQKRDRLAASHAPGDGQWYCLIAGNELGPLDARELRRMVRDGAIKPDDLVRCGPNGVWTPSRQANFP